MDIEEIIGQYYPAGSGLRELLETHSRMVVRKALECADRHRLDVDRQFVEEAGMLHDIGIFRCDAPDILCRGALPYICHGTEGARLLRGLGLDRHARVCERHTGAGLTREEILAQELPLPAMDLLPETLEEKLICYADKFFSKSGDAEEEKPLERVRRSLARHGAATLARFEEMHRLFG